MPGPWFNVRLRGGHWEYTEDSGETWKILGFPEGIDILSTGVTAGWHIVADGVGGVCWEAINAKPPTIVNVANYDILADDAILHVTRATMGFCVLRWMTAQIVASNRRVVIKDGSGGAGTFPITLTCEGGEFIDGQPNVIISGNHDSITVYSDGIGLSII